MSQFLRCFPTSRASDAARLRRIVGCAGYRSRHVAPTSMQSTIVRSPRSVDADVCVRGFDRGARSLGHAPETALLRPLRDACIEAHCSTRMGHGAVTARPRGAQAERQRAQRAGRSRARSRHAGGTAARGRTQPPRSPASAAERLISSYLGLAGVVWHTTHTGSRESARPGRHCRNSRRPP